MTVITGTEGVGKTSLALSCAKEVIQAGGNVLYINTETLFPHVAAESVGVTKDNLYVASPLDFGEQLLNVIEEMLFDPSSRSARNLLDLIIIDSINGLVPKAAVDKAEREGAEGVDIGVRARMLSKFTERVMGKGLLRKGCAMILIAQQRVDINTYGAPLTMSGGKALRYNPKIILSLRKRFVKSKEDIVGHEVHFEIEKNGISGFPTRGSYQIVYGVGVDDSMEVFEKALELGVIEKKGRSEYVFHFADGQTLTVQGGIASAREMVKVDVDIKNRLKDAIASKT
jgi:protein RecA